MDHEISVIQDPGTDSHVTVIPYTASQEVQPLHFDDLFAKFGRITWTKVHGSHGKEKRSSAWYTAAGCICPYVYSGKPWEALSVTPWMYELAKDIAKIFEIPEAVGPPNAINFNFDKDRTQGLWWHADKEDLFKGPTGQATIISLSLGSSKEFKLKRKYEDDGDAVTTTLKSGDLLKMAGMTQSFDLHMVPEEACASSSSATSHIRYNTTFRWVHRHTKKCESAWSNSSRSI